MTAPRTCDHCGCALDAGEVCDCTAREETGGSMEFEMLTDMASIPKSIDFNFEALKKGLSERLELYRGLVVTEDGIKEAKEDRAKLNKLREALESKRKEVKRECMAPYTAFEGRVKELVGLIDQPIAAIDAQLKEYEEKRRAEKREAVKAFYEQTIGTLYPLLPFEKLWQDRWYNTGVSMKKIHEEIVTAETKAASDLEVLATVESEFAEAVKIKYLETLNLSDALAERARLQLQAERLREFEAARQEAQTASAAENGVPAGTQQSGSGGERKQSGESELSGAPGSEGCGASADEEETIYLLRFECQLTRNQAAELSTWLKQRNIQYRRI